MFVKASCSWILSKRQAANFENLQQRRNQTALNCVLISKILKYISGANFTFFRLSGSFSLHSHERYQKKKRQNKQEMAQAATFSTRSCLSDLGVRLNTQLARETNLNITQVIRGISAASWTLVFLPLSPKENLDENFRQRFLTI
jgi:hypothetical protein